MTAKKRASTPKQQTEELAPPQMPEGQGDIEVTTDQLAVQHLLDQVAEQARNHAVELTNTKIRHQQQLIELARERDKYKFLLGQAQDSSVKAGSDSPE